MLKTFIGYYKNARSILTEIFIGLTVEEDKVFRSEGEDRDTLTFMGGDSNDDFSDDFLNS